MMKISIVIPAYNEEKALAKTIESALTQDYSDFEVIVVNNASSDRTLEIAQSYAGKYPARVKTVTENRKGLLWARECGRTNASGEIIANIDADCLPSTDWLSHGVRYFVSDRVAAVSGPYDYYDGGFIFRYVSLYTQMSIYWIISRIIQLPFVRTGAVMIGGNNMIRAKALENAGGYNTSLTFYGEDTDTAMRVVKSGKIIFSNKLIMKTSARRFRSEGIINLEIKYLKHFFKIIFKKN